MFTPFHLCVFLVVAVIFIIVYLYFRQKADNVMSPRPWKIHVDDPGDEETNSLILQHVNFDFSEKRDCDFILSQKFRRGMAGAREYHQNLLDEYGKESKPVLIFWITDSVDIYFPPPNVYFYRTSIFKTLRKPNEDVLPFVWETVPDFHVFDTDRPIVGFCGGAWGNRKRMIQLLEEHPFFDTNFIVRDQFWGGRPNDDTLRHEFQQNLLESQFTICNRGQGNFTMRFYQALSCGRTPILIDTDMLFPFEDEIDWDQFIVRSDCDESVLEKTLDFFHKRDMKQQQIMTKNMFDTYFQPTTYFNTIFRLHCKPD